MNLQDTLRAALAGVYTSRPRSTPPADLLRMSRDLLALPHGRLEAWEVKLVSALERVMSRGCVILVRSEAKLKVIWGREFRP